MINGRHAIRDNDWKLVSPARHEDAATIEKSRFGLYNLADDLAEQNDISQTHPEMTEQLFHEYRKFAEDRELK